MASIYDLARITSGDPMSQVERGAKEASTRLAQYEHQKEIIEEINKQIKAAEKKAKKNKQGWGLGGSLLGGLLGAGLTAATGGLGMAALAPYMSTLGAGLGAGIAEKGRQKHVGATKGLKDLEKKLKGRKQLSDLEGVTEGIEGSLDQMVMSDALNAMTMDMIMPGITEKAKEAVGKVTTKDLIGETLVPSDMLKEVTDIVPGESVAEKLIQEGSSMPIAPDLDLAGEAIKSKPPGLRPSGKSFPAIKGVRPAAPGAGDVFDPNLTSFGYGAEVQLDPLGVSQEGVTAIDSFGDSLAIDPGDAAFYKDQGYTLIDPESGPGFYKPELDIQKRFETDPGGLTYVDTPDGTVEMLIGPSYDIQSQSVQEDFIPIKQGNVRSEYFQADPSQTEAKLVTPEIKIPGYESAEILPELGTSGYGTSGYVPEGIGAEAGYSMDVIEEAATPNTVNIGGIKVPISDDALSAFQSKANMGQNIMRATPMGRAMQGMMPEGLEGLMNNKFFQNPYINNLMKILGPQLMAPSMPQQRRFTGPTFRNPYGGGGGY